MMNARPAMAADDRMTSNASLRRRVPGFATSEGGMIARLTCSVKIGYNLPNAIDLS